MQSQGSRPKFALEPQLDLNEGRPEMIIIRLAVARDMQQSRLPWLLLTRQESRFPRHAR